MEFYQVINCNKSSIKCWNKNIFFIRITMHCYSNYQFNWRRYIFKYGWVFVILLSSEKAIIGLCYTDNNVIIYISRLIFDGGYTNSNPIFFAGKTPLKSGHSSVFSKLTTSTNGAYFVMYSFSIQWTGLFLCNETGTWTFSSNATIIRTWGWVILQKREILPKLTP